MRNGEILDYQKYPSPSPDVHLFLVTYLSGGLKVKGLLAEPAEEGLYDGFLYLRGGIKGVGMVRPGRIVQFASEGFVVMAPFYRGNQGGEGNEDFAGEDREDALSALDLLAGHPKVHPGRIHAFGFSRGGVMALIAGNEREDLCSVVTWGGVSDMVLTYEEREDLRRMMKRVIGGSPNKKPEAYEWRTPLHDLEKMKAPMLIIHGAKDENVSLTHSRLLKERADELGKRAETWYFEEYTHYFPPSVNRNTVKRLTEWMKKQPSV
ncbi:prolyl oligopeptidase family serine peptidase [Bacillus mangrovi]|uniref:Prolyl oligopeptidase family serine peptidase n=1 Tax=Metabacillus mangrovi TaxID=1491830 RepID=A0A7X2S6B0_9BACI|nr:prolyl oligopeptidase family serine peptidase [Metabacillus mangrovi]MTH54459.1 prolyl oligopeptidase family serine peptidase [Metabacillus mangrovi]